jgi:hypothetical protein
LPGDGPSINVRCPVLGSAPPSTGPRSSLQRYLWARVGAVVVAPIVQEVLWGTAASYERLALAVERRFRGTDRRTVNWGFTRRASDGHAMLSRVRNVPSEYWVLAIVLPAEIAFVLWIALGR